MEEVEYKLDNNNSKAEDYLEVTQLQTLEEEGFLELNLEQVPILLLGAVFLEVLLQLKLLEVEVFLEEVLQQLSLL